MNWTENYKKFESDSGNEEYRMSESESYPKAEIVRIFPECSQLWIEHTTW